MMQCVADCNWSGMNIHVRRVHQWRSPLFSSSSPELFPLFREGPWIVHLSLLHCLLSLPTRMWTLTDDYLTWRPI